MRLGGIGCNKDCCEANTEHPKAAKNASYLCDRKNGVGGRAKARSNEKRRGKRVDYILNSKVLAIL